MEARMTMSLRSLLYKVKRTAISLRAWAREELWNPEGDFDRWGIYALLSLSVGLLSLAYQVKLSYFIDLGGDFDFAYVKNFYGRERNEEYSYRWSKDTSFVNLPGIGGGYPLRLSLQINGWRPEAFQPAVISLIINGQTKTGFVAEGVPRSYEFVLTDHDRVRRPGDLIIEIRSNTFRPSKTIPGSDDPRDLGVIVDWVQVEPLPLSLHSLTVPSLSQVTYLTGIVLVFYLLIHQLGASRGLSFLSAFCLLIAMSYILAFHRLAITSYSPQLLALLISGGAMWILGKGLVQRLYRWAGVEVSQKELRWVFAIFLIGFAIKFGGLIHPQMLSCDLRFYVADIHTILQGRFFEELYFPNVHASHIEEWGLGAIIPYSPLPLLVASPLAFLPLDLALSLKWLMSLLDTSIVFLIYLVVRNIYGKHDAGLFASFLYIVMPPLFTASSWGVLPTLFGQWVAVATFTFLMGKYGELDKPRVFWGFTGLLSFALLSHPFTFVFACIMLSIMILSLGWLTWDRKDRNRAKYLFLSLALSLFVAFVLYYGWYVEPLLHKTIPAFWGRLLNSGGIGRGPSGGLREFYEALVSKLPPYVTITSMLGFVILVVKRNPLAWLMTAWLSIYAIFTAIGLWLYLFEKHVFFVVPAVSICSAVFLSIVYQRGWVGKVVALIPCAYLAWEGLSVWYDAIIFGFSWLK